MNIPQKCLLFCIIIALTITAVPIGARQAVKSNSFESASILDSRITHDVDYSGTLRGAMEEILRGTEITGGVIQQSGECSTESLRPLILKKGSTVSEGLKTLVTVNTDYQWKFEDHVLYLMPKVSHPSLLEVRLRSYHLHTTENWRPSASLADVFKSPEVRRRAAELGLSSGTIAIVGGQGGFELHHEQKSFKPIDIELKNVSVQTALDHIVRAYGNAIWVYTETTCEGKKTFTIDGWLD